MKDPTSKHCSNRDVVFEDEYKIGYACWYPQMGGYVGKCVALFDKGWKEYGNNSAQGGCVDVFVWHDGEFPFSENDGIPHELHHCSPKQFIDFGKFLLKINEHNKIKIDGLPGG